jgi:hypothetical protein
MSVFFRKFPFYPWLLALYPALALLAHNVAEVQVSAALRPLLASLLLVTVIFLVFLLILRDAGKSALCAALCLLLFFSYGHVYQALRGLSGDALLGRHRYLAPLYFGLLILGMWGIRQLKDPAIMTQTLNVVSLVLVAMPLLSTMNYYRVESANAAQVGAVPSGDALKFAGQGTPPDVYFIVLDTYMRGDALKQDLHYDNSEFLNSLKEMGFYVAECSRPNYDYTHASVTSTLNMDYIPALRAELSSQGITSSKAVWTLLVHSKTRRLLEELGYRTVAFDSTFAWSEMEDADVYLAPGRESASLRQLLPFEAMFVQSTAATLLTDSQTKFSKPVADIVNFPFNYHVQTERYLLDTLPSLAKMPGPKFVFVHVMIPHVPYVFEPDGSIRTDPKYYGGRGATAINAQYEQRGYVDSVKFINSRMLPILKTLIQESVTPPIIIMEGDHGLEGDNRVKNLSAYFLPGKDNSGLYRNITPVNSFRVIFNDYFEAHYGLLADKTYQHDTELVPETAPACVP